MKWYVFQEPYEIVGDSATNEDHYGPAKARLSESLLLRHFEICCVGTFHNLTPGMSSILISSVGGFTTTVPMTFQLLKNCSLTLTITLTIHYLTLCLLPSARLTPHASHKI